VPLFTHSFATPLGSARAVLDSDGALVALTLLHDGMSAEGYTPPPIERYERSYQREELIADAARGAEVECQLGEYFARQRRDFDLPLAPRGSEFQRQVWAELCRIPYGQTISYGEQARRMGDPSLSRAVGAANGANPIWLVIPCHRVIGSDGSLVGYGGGLPVKRALLEHEGALSASLFPA
jgi:methylated-DNA-[protein]-cysteine S-methyltransferase